jgi:hypothetical protein
MSASGVEILDVRIYRHEVEPMACAGPEVHLKRCSGVMKDASPNVTQQTLMTATKSKRSSTTNDP